MKNNIFLTLILAVNFFASLPMHSSQASTQQLNNITISPTVIFYISNQLFWLIATTPITVLGMQKIKTLLKEKTAVAWMNSRNVNQKVADFVNSEVKKITDIPLDGIMMSATCSQNFPIGSLSKHILMAQYVENEIMLALENNNTAILNKWKAVIQHEASHIKNNDVYWRAIFELITPFLIGGTINYFVNTHKHRSFWLKQYWTVYFGLVSYCLSMFARSIFSKYQEQRADDTIINNPSLLMGMKQFLNDFEDINKKNYTLPRSTYPFMRWYCNLFEDHPLHKIRIKKLNQRIAALKKQQEEQRSS